MQAVAILMRSNLRKSLIARFQWYYVLEWARA